MKNGTRKKTDSVLASSEPRDLRAEVEKRAYEIWRNSLPPFFWTPVSVVFFNV